VVWGGRWKSEKEGMVQIDTLFFINTYNYVNKTMYMRETLSIDPHSTNITGNGRGDRSPAANGGGGL